MPDPQAIFAATFVDEIIRCGIRHVVVSPGKRSTLLAAAFARRNELRTHVIVDERVAAFFALGIGIATGQPALLWCTSGTATAELHAAVLEADAARVPMLVCTADRPPENQHVRDWQTANQRSIFNNAVRWQFDFGVADMAMAHQWRSIAARAVAETMCGEAGSAGPVHCNVPIREPISLEVAAPIEGRSNNMPWHQWLPITRMSLVPEFADGARGVFVVGPDKFNTPQLLRCAEHLGWPILAEARSGARVRHAAVVAHGELLCAALDQSMQPDIIIELGDAAIGPNLRQWIINSTTHGAALWRTANSGIWQGSAAYATHVIKAPIDSFLEQLLSTASTASRTTALNTEWLITWRRLDDVARKHVEEAVWEESSSLLAPQVVARIVRSLSKHANLVCASSMAVRDVEWFCAPREDLALAANRGLSGIDGTISTAMGIAVASQEPTVVLTGDLAFLHDVGALWATKAMHAVVPLTIVVMDDNGGGIFDNFGFAEPLGDKLYQSILRTPHNADIPRIFEGFDVPCVQATSAEDARRAVGAGFTTGQCNAVYVAIDADASNNFRTELRAATAQAIRRALQ